MGSDPRIDGTIDGIDWDQTWRLGTGVPVPLPLLTSMCYNFPYNITTSAPHLLSLSPPTPENGLCLQPFCPLRDLREDHSGASNRGKRLVA